MDISTFSKASKQRNKRPFLEIYEELIKRVNRQKATDEICFIPIDATIITLTSKLLCNQGFNEVKLISDLDLSSGGTTDNLVTFGKKYDINFRPELVASLPDKAVAIIDRGFAGLDFMAEMERNNKYFILRINQNYNPSFIEGSELFKVGTGKEAGEYRVVNFCSLESRQEYRLVSNLPLSGEEALNQTEIVEAYKKRWSIEIFWKFRKMHFKLDELITKNVKGISLQIYASLIVYLILKLVEIPK
jgi:putative transposase